MAERIKFTDTRVTALRDAAMPGRRTEYVDSKVSALRLRVSSGSASWSVLKRIPGGPMRRVSLGSADSLSVEGARKAARKVLEHLCLGITPKKGSIFADYTEINTCALCGTMGPKKSVRARLDVWGWNLNRNDYEKASKHVLCVPCWNKVRPFEKKVEEAGAIESLVKELRKETNECQRSQQQAN